MYIPNDQRRNVAPTNPHDTLITYFIVMLASLMIWGLTMP